MELSLAINMYKFEFLTVYIIKSRIFKVPVVTVPENVCSQGL